MNEKIDETSELFFQMFENYLNNYKNHGEEGMLEWVDQLLEDILGDEEDLLIRGGEDYQERTYEEWLEYYGQHLGDEDIQD